MDLLDRALAGADPFIMQTDGKAWLPVDDRRAG